MVKKLLGGSSRSTGAPGKTSTPSITAKKRGLGPKPPDTSKLQPPPGRVIPAPPDRVTPMPILDPTPPRRGVAPKPVDPSFRIGVPKPPPSTTPKPPRRREKPAQVSPEVRDQAYERFGPGGVPKSKKKAK